MIRSSILALIPLVSLSACAGPAQADEMPRTAYHAAALVTEHRDAPDAAAMAALVLAQATKLSSPRPPEVTRAPSAAPLERVRAANREAAREPEAGAYVGAAQLYPWTEGAVYRLYTAPEQVSDIALEAGESLVSVAAGDTVRWIIGDTSSGSGAARRTHILVKPSIAGLRTNLVIATDRRVYHLEVESTPRTAMASISWTYPEDALLALKRNTATEQPVAQGIAVEALNFNYRIDGDNPSWRPVRAFDDGHQVFIEFPPALAQGEAPPLFVRGQGGRTQLVNYRVRGRYYIVDRLFAAAELRLGERHQQVVRITRQGRVS